MFKRALILLLIVVLYIMHICIKTWVRYHIICTMNFKEMPFWAVAYVPLRPPDERRRLSNLIGSYDDVCTRLQNTIHSININIWIITPFPELKQFSKAETVCLYFYCLFVVSFIFSCVSNVFTVRQSDEITSLFISSQWKGI